MTTVVDELGFDETRHDPDDVLRELLERQHLILEMQSTVGWKLWADFLAALVTPYQNRLLKGRHKDMLDYQRDAGIVEGIRLALTATESLEARIGAARLALAQERQLADEGEPQ